VTLIKRIKELYEYRDLLITMAIKELKLQYRNSILGFFWSLLNPLLMMLIFTFVLGQIFRIGIKNFPIFLLTGLFAWNFFNSSIVGGTGSIVSNANLVKKVYFPREILPLSIVLASLFNFVLSLVVLFLFLIYYGYSFWPFLPLLVVVIIIELILVSGISMLLASLNVYFRDIQHTVSVGMLALFYATPILYDISMIEKSSMAQAHPWIMYVYKLNPLVWVIQLYRDILYYNQWPTLKMFAIAAAGAAIIFVAGYVVFHKLEPRFPEEV
jgi:lipopolysaccharide transport system permease protein